MIMKEIKEHDYKYWQNYFDTNSAEYRENICGIGPWDEITHIGGDKNDST